MTKEAIVVADTPDNLRKIEQYIEQMDQPPPQVLIEAHILEVTLDDDHQHGVNYEHIIGGDFTLDMTGFADPLASPALFARIDGSNVDALIECLKTTNDTKTLASPRVMVINGQKARIQLGEQLGYRVVTVTETAAVEDVKFLEVGVCLDVTPQITRDDRVLLRVKPKVSSGRVNAETELPEEETREVETDVLLADGQGVVVGGLIQERDSNRQWKVPWLGDLYLVGKLFERREVVKERTEIIVTLVPRISRWEWAMDERDMLDLERSRMRLFHGPLERLPRPEPMLPDPIYNPRPIWLPGLHGSY
jgi:type II secretory pathway component GspD/PulD (secretin)